MTERWIGRIEVNPRGFGFLRTDDGGLAFIAPPDLNRFLHGDRASGDVAFHGQGRASARSIELVERTRERLFGELATHGRRRFVRVDRAVSNTDWPLPAGADRGLPDGTAVVALLTEDRASIASIERVVGHDEDPGWLRCLTRHGVRTDWSPTLLADAERAANHREFGHRRDLRALPTITIDAPYSRDLDDALAVLPATPDGGLRVLVSIADVDAFVPEGSALDREARARGTSVYLADRVVPMLPERLCDDAISLLPEQERPALTVELRIDPEGNVTAFDVEKTLIRSHARLSYTAVAELFETGKSDEIPPAVLPTLRWLRAAAGRLSAARAARGGLELAREEASVRLEAKADDAPGNPRAVALESRSDTRAHRLIERLMVAANEAVAAWLVARGLPGIFRVHAPPDADRVERLATFARHAGLEAGFGKAMTPRALTSFEAQLGEGPLAQAVRMVMMRLLGPASYRAEPGPHFGLAAPLYLHFTSPIRRYADLAVHRVIKRHLDGDRSLVAGDPAFAALADALTEASGRAAKAESERARMLIARLAAGRIGARVRGTVISVQGFGLVVQITGGDDAGAALLGATGTVSLEALTARDARGNPPSIARVDWVAQALRDPEDGTIRWTLGDMLDLEVVAASELLGRIELG